MKITMPHALWKVVGYPTDLRQIREGLVITKLGGVFQQFSVAADTLFRGRINEALLMQIMARLDLKNCVASPDFVSLIYVMSDNCFDDFASLAVSLEYILDEYKEQVIDTRCYYTNDEQFKGIPDFKGGDSYDEYLRNTEKWYDKSKVYFISIDSLSVLRGCAEKAREYLIYIPSDMITRYE